MKLEGLVRKERVGIGSKSEHTAVVLTALQNGVHSDYILRTRMGNPFNDPKLVALVGKHIIAYGKRFGSHYYWVDSYREKPQGNP